MELPHPGGRQGATGALHQRCGHRVLSTHQGMLQRPIVLKFRLWTHRSLHCWVQHDFDRKRVTYQVLTIRINAQSRCSITLLATKIILQRLAPEHQNSAETRQSMDTWHSLALIATRCSCTSWPALVLGSSQESRCWWARSHV